MQYLLLHCGEELDQQESFAESLRWLPQAAEEFVVGMELSVMIQVAVGKEQILQLAGHEEL